MMNWDPWKPSFEILARGHASPASQNKLLRTILQLRMHEIESLKAEILALKNGRELEAMALSNQVEALRGAQKRLEAKMSPTPAPQAPPKKSWWRRK